MRQAGESRAATTRRASQESRRRATTTRLVRAASKAVEQPKVPVLEMSISHDRRNPAPPSAKRAIPKAGTANHSANRSANCSANSAQATESLRQGCGRDVENVETPRSRAATRETRGRLAVGLVLQLVP